MRGPYGPRRSTVACIPGVGGHSIGTGSVTPFPTPFNLMPPALITIAAALAATGWPELAAPPHAAAKVVVPANAPAFEESRLYVKFRDGLVIRPAGDGRGLTDRGTGDLGPAAADLAAVGGTWSPVHVVDEATLHRLRETATKNLGRPTPDHTTEFYLALPPGTSTDQAQATLRGLEVVQYVGRVPRPVEPPAVPDFTPNQGYLRDAALGHGSETVRSWPGGRGQAVRICDLEYSWNLSHVDLPTVTRIGPAGTDPFNNTNHGTAVLGVMLARDDGAGTTGMSPSASGHVVPVYRNSTWDIGAAIITALTELEAGDILLIEQQVQGPNWPGAGQAGLVPSDWILGWYNAAVTATGNGVVVIEAAGNGSENLDDPIYSSGNGGHWPFLPENDSGAIIVGGGLTPSHLAEDRTRSASSNYGSAVELHSWSTRVATLGFGTLYSAEGINVFYASSFSGTSSATALVGGVAAQLQSVHKMVRGVPMTPAAMRDVLRATGLPQQDGVYPATQSVGPRPNVLGAIFHVLEAVDCDSNGVPDEIDIRMSPALDSDFSGALDACERPCDTRFSLVHNAPALIPGNSSAGTGSSLIAPPGLGPVVDVEVWVELTHLFAGDVTLTLSHGGTSVPLVARAGRNGVADGDSSDFEGRYTFMDSAAGDLWSAAAAAGATTAIPAGAYTPVGPWAVDGPATSSLRAFAGDEAAGQWTLTAADEKAADPGTRIRWGLVLTVRSPDCCLADFDGDGTAGVPDLFRFLEDWFAARSAADVDLDGDVDVPDVFAFLGAWFEGCA